MIEWMRKKFPGKDISRIITVILIGILVLVVLMPVKSGGRDETGQNDKATGSLLGEAEASNETKAATDNEGTTAYDEAYYEERLKNILEKSYGIGTIDVMIHMKKESDTDVFYNSATEAAIIDGVLIVARINDMSQAMDISNAVCALFNLPACKVSVLMR